MRGASHDGRDHAVAVHSASKGSNQSWHGRVTRLRESELGGMAVTCRFDGGEIVRYWKWL